MRMRVRAQKRAAANKIILPCLFVQKFFMFLDFCCQGFWIDFSFDFNSISISLWTSYTSKMGKQGSRLCSLYKLANFQIFLKISY